MPSIHPLAKLAGLGDWAGMRILYASSGPFSVADLENALHHAVSGDSSEVLDDLAKWSLEADPEGHLKRLGQHLGTAIYDRKLKCVAKFIDLDAHLECRNERGASALHQAAEYGRIPALRLLAPRVPLDTENPWGETALHLACRSLKSEAVEILVEAGADPKRPDAKGRNAMDHARRGVADTVFDLDGWWDDAYYEDVEEFDPTPFESTEDAYVRICAALSATERSAESGPSAP